MQIHRPTIDLVNTYMKHTSRVAVHILSCYYHSVCLTRESLISFEKTVSLPNKWAPLSRDASFSSWVDQYVTDSLDNSSFLIATISSAFSFDNQSFDCLCECLAVDSNGILSGESVVYVQPLLVATTSLLRHLFGALCLSSVPLDPVMWSFYRIEVCNFNCWLIMSQDPSHLRMGEW